jgi:hypothetical protein
VALEVIWTAVANDERVKTLLADVKGRTADLAAVLPKT